jgi:hypothetical protein
VIAKLEKFTIYNAQFTMVVRLRRGIFQKKHRGGAASTATNYSLLTIETRIEAACTSCPRPLFY